MSDTIARVNFAEQARRHVEERRPGVEPHSAEEMFLRLLERGAQARAAGNYGIAAAYVLRSGGTELICFGENTVFTGRDPAGHAEMNALRLARRIAFAAEHERRELLSDPRHAVVRRAPHDRFETILYTTLEPCPMCTVGIINAAVQQVVIAQADEAAGALLHLDRLPSLWRSFADQRKVEITSAGDHPGGACVPAVLLDLLNRLFLDGKAALDEQLGSTAALPIDELVSAVDAWGA